MNSGSVIETPAVLLPFIVVVGAYVWTALALAAMFRKAGEPAWAGWVPIYNQMVLSRMAGYSPYLGLLSLAGVGGVLVLFLSLRINHGFRAPAWYAVLAFLAVPVWVSILGFGRAQWHGIAPGVDWTGQQPVPNDPSVPFFGAFASAEPGAAAPGHPQPAAEPAWGNGGAPFGQQPAGATGVWGGGQAPWSPSDAAPATWPDAPASAWPDAASAASQPGAPAAAWPEPAAPEQHQAAPARTSAWTPSAEPGAWNAPAAEQAVVSPQPAAPAGAPASAAADGGWTPPQPPTPQPPMTQPPTVQSQQGPAAAPTSFPPAPSMPASVAAAAASPEQAAAQWAATPQATQEEILARAGATRMSDDSEVVAAARAAQAAEPAAPEATPIDDDEEGPVGPIVVPGPSGQQRGVIPPPPMPQQPAMEDSWVPRVRRSAYEPMEPGLDMSAEVSAVAGAPDAGAPLSARSSIAAQHRAAAVEGGSLTQEIPGDAEPFDDATELAVRHRPAWVLTPPTGEPIAVEGNVLILGRKPSGDGAASGAQLVAITDTTRTVSKTHAHLELVDGVWQITDLGSTNGVVLIDATGKEQELEAGVAAPLTERFLLGDAELRLASA